MRNIILRMCGLLLIMVFCGSLFACDASSVDFSTSHSTSHPASSLSADESMSGAGSLAPEPPPPPIVFDPSQRLGDIDFPSVMTNFACLSAQRLYAEGEEGLNFCYSPVSLYLALGLVAQGAGGETRAQLFDVLGLPEDAQAVIDQEVQAWLSVQPSDWMMKMTEGEGNVVEIGNSVWLNNTRHSFAPDFAGMAADTWEADLFELPLGTAAANAEIAQWVSEATKGLLTPPVETSADTAMALFNTVYLSGRWYDEFDPADNTQDAFTCADGSDVDTEYMNQSLYGWYYQKGEGYTQTGMGLNCGAAINWVLPDPDVRIQDLLVPEVLNEIFWADNYEQCETLILGVPKFAFNTSINPLPVLQELGVRDAFIPGGADFTDLSTSKNVSDMFISAIMQNTYISVDEEGVKASAVTEVVLAEGIEEFDGIVTFTLDRPFLFYIDYYGAPLFVGVVANPQA